MMRTAVGISRVRTLFTNGHVLTMEPENPVAEAVAVDEEGRIAAVGSRSEVEHLSAAGVQRIDLNGRTLSPGFFDCHAHLLWLGTNLGHVDLSSPPVADADDIIRLMRERLATASDSGCIQGNRYDQNKLRGRRHLSRHDLDRVSKQIPVRIVHTSGHAAVVNTRALEMLGITQDTPDPAGGSIERDADGVPTGLLLESASWNDLDRIVPEPTPSEAVEALRRANGYLLARGITSATDANTAPGAIEWFTRAAAADALTVRTNCMVAWADVVAQAGEGEIPSPEALQPAHALLNGHRLYVGQAKLFADGAITTRTCLLSQPFEGTADNFGIAMHSDAELYDLIWKAHRSGWQIATHAIGDRAVDLVLGGYAEAQRRHSRHRPDHRIEHCMLLDAGLIARMRRQRVWSIGQPEFLSSLGDAYFAALGEERAHRLSPYATLEEQNVAQAFSSDCPVVPGAPLDGMLAAIRRTTPEGRVIGPGECISAESALYAYTAAPAYASRVERDRGTIAVGKWADFTVLLHDPVQTSVSDWDRIAVVATYLAGVRQYGELE